MKHQRIVMGACSLILFATTLNATSTHTFVAATGNDSTGTGTALKPYATFATAAANTAAGGLVTVMGPGDYGAVTLTQSITIDGTGGGTIGFAGDGEGIYIDPAAAANIVIRNLTIDGGGTGSDAIFIASAGATNVVNVLIDGCRMQGFTQIGVGLGSESPMYVTVKNTSIQGGTLGVRTFQSSGNVVNDHVQLNHVDIQGASSAGLFMRNGNADVLDSTISGSVGMGVNGIEADTSATINVQHSMITSNTNGTCIYSGSTAVIGTTTIIADNTTNVEACGGVVNGAGGAAPSPKL